MFAVFVGTTVLFTLGFISITATTFECLGVLDSVGTPIPIEYCVTNINFALNTSFKYQCAADGAQLNKIFYNDRSCDGIPSLTVDATSTVLDFNCNSKIECDVFDVQILSGVECQSVSNDSNSSLSNNNNVGLSLPARNVFSIGIVPDQCLDISQLALSSNASSGRFICNSTYYEVIHYEGMFILEFIIALALMDKLTIPQSIIIENCDDRYLDEHCEGDIVDTMRYDGCEDNVDIQVIDCPLFHTTTFVTTQDTENDNFQDLFSSTLDILLLTNDVVMTTDSPDSIEIDESSRNDILWLSTIAGFFISAVWFI